MALLNLFKKTKEFIAIPELGEFTISKYEGKKAALKKISNKMGDKFSLVFYLYKGSVTENQIEFYKNFEANWETFSKETQKMVQNQESVKLKSLVIIDVMDNSYDYVCEASTNSHVMVLEKEV